MVVDRKNDCPDVLKDIEPSSFFDIDKIRKNAPEGATHYYKVADKVIYYKKHSGLWVEFNKGDILLRIDGKKENDRLSDSLSSLYFTPKEGKEVKNHCKHTTEDVLTERQSQYGNYSDVARITQEIKTSLLSGASYDKLSDEQKLSLDMIANKMARAVNGDVSYVDNWQDICGYAQLVVDSLSEKL